MKGKLIMVGGYLLSGIISCIALAGVAGSAEKAALPPAAPQESESAPAPARAPEADSSEVKMKPKRGRRSAAKKAEGAEDSATPRKTRTRKNRKAASHQE